MARLLHVVLATWLLLALPLGQHAALVHALGHATTDHVDGQAPSPEQCPEHSLYTAFTGAVASGTTSSVAFAAAASSVEETLAAVVAASPRHDYLSHAPPISPARV